jgi:hypothetical protein
MADRKEKDTLDLEATSQTPPAVQEGSLTEFCEKLKNELQAKELSCVRDAKLDDDQLKLVQERLYKMIDYTVKRHDWFVDQCHRLLQIGLALIASGGVIVSLVARLDNLTRITQILAWLFGFSLFGTGLWLVHLYNRYMAREHPYRKVVDINSWIFHYRFPGYRDPNLSKSAETAKRQVQQEA